MKHVSRIALAVLAATTTALASAEPAYPSKPVKIIVGYAPGGSADTVARLLANRLSIQMGQSFVVENRPGAASSIAASGVARAPADGYTLFLGSNANAINTTLYKKLTFDIQKDFAPVALVTSFPNVMVVNPALPVKTVGEFIAYAKSHPDGVNYGSSGIGSSTHLAAEMFKSMAGIKMEHVQYKGSAPALTDLMAGQVQVMFDNAPSVLPFIRSGKLRALAVTSSQPQAFAPQVPTVSGAALPGYEVKSWYGLFAPARTPPAIVNALNQQINAALQEASVRGNLAALGASPEGGMPEAMRKHLGQEVTKWAAVIRSSGVTAE
ncbi:tripartite tricarboxylate transporter substrate binding protein [Cupriavidus basilensis]|uniref:tripartite tricarboxylate transporter substrate binding protein n=1 Tax=Cupriavidus basilensis TaxID=68895 RepID=UPI000750B599|nr:tripartite tricarboxylate transporter substrate binding protein [Cupriavidus basilensis]